VNVKLREVPPSMTEQKIMEAMRLLHRPTADEVRIMASILANTYDDEQMRDLLMIMVRWTHHG